VSEPIVIPPGEGHRLGNVEFLARTVDTPRFNFQIIEIAPGRVLEAPPGVEHGFRNDGAEPVRMLNIHAPAGFDRRIGLPDSSP
jgi:hypothetical protein